MFIADFILDVLFGSDSFQHEKLIALVLTKLVWKVWPKSQSLTMTLSAQCYYNHTDLKTKSSFFYIDSLTDAYRAAWESPVIC